MTKPFGEPFPKLAHMSPKDRMVFDKELKRQAAILCHVATLRATTDPIVWNQAAIDLLDLQSPPLIDQEAVNVIIEKLLDPQSHRHNGTLMYVLTEMGAPIKSSVAVHVLINNIGEPVWECLNHIKKGLIEPDGLIDQLKLLEVEMAKREGEHYQDLFDGHAMLTEMALIKPMQLPFNTTFRQIPWPIAILNVRVDVLAKQANYRLDEWDEDGLGPARGFAVILPTGLWVLFREQEISIERGVCNGPTVEVDTFPVPEIDNLLAQVLNAFDLTDADVQTKRIRNTDAWT